MIATLNDYESPYPLLIEEAHQITFQQRCINSLMIEVYKYLNGHSPDIMNGMIWIIVKRKYVQSPKFPLLLDRNVIEIQCYSISW